MELQCFILFHNHLIANSALCERLKECVHNRVNSGRSEHRAEDSGIPD